MCVCVCVCVTSGRHSRLTEYGEYGKSIDGITSGRQKGGGQKGGVICIISRFENMTGKVAESRVIQPLGKVSAAAGGAWDKGLPRGGLT